MTAEVIVSRVYGESVDDSAWYVDGKLVGRSDQIDVAYSVLPLASGKVFQFTSLELKDDVDPSTFYWPETFLELVTNKWLP